MAIHTLSEYPPFQERTRGPEHPDHLLKTLVSSLACSLKCPFSPTPLMLSQQLMRSSLVIQQYCLLLAFISPLAGTSFSQHQSRGFSQMPCHSGIVHKLSTSHHLMVWPSPGLPPSMTQTVQLQLPSSPHKMVSPSESPSFKAQHYYQPWCPLHEPKGLAPPPGLSKVMLIQGRSPPTYKANRIQLSKIQPARISDSNSLTTQLLNFPSPAQPL